MPKVRLTKKQLNDIYFRIEKFNIYKTPFSEWLEIDQSQLINEPIVELTNADRWNYFFNNVDLVGKNLGEVLDSLSYDATPAYNEVMKDGK